MDEAVMAASRQELLDGPRNSGPSPDDRLLGVQEEPKAHHRQPVDPEGLDLLAVHRKGLLLQAQQCGQRWAVYVRIQQPYALPPPGEGEGQVDRHGRLAHPSLARSDGHDPPHAGQARG